MLTADVAKASRKGDGRVVIPFSLKNNSDHEVTLHFGAWSGNIDGLAVVNPAGKITFIENIGLKRPQTYGKSGPIVSYTLKPGESVSDTYSEYSTEILAKVKGREIFGVLSGYIENEKKRFTSYSAPFVVPSELAELPWIDLGEQHYLSIVPNATESCFGGGDFPTTTAAAQKLNPDYPNWVKNGWADYALVPFAVKNNSDQPLAVTINAISYYFAGDEKDKNATIKKARWSYLNSSLPIIKPGESIPCESQWKLSWLEQDGYKPGNKIIAVIGGRIAGTNKIFECYSAPFELPPLPKGEPQPTANKP